jgi:hypothetical protein
MTRPLTVLIVGGYGTFGARLAQLLSHLGGLTLLIGGRSLERAQEFCSGVTGRARLEPMLFDRNGPVEEQLRRLLPDLVVDASGPFQSYGDKSYELVSQGNDRPPARERLLASSKWRTTNRCWRAGRSFSAREQSTARESRALLKRMVG